MHVWDYTEANLWTFSMCAWNNPIFKSGPWIWNVLLLNESRVLVVPNLTLHFLLDLSNGSSECGVDRMNGSGGTWTTEIPRLRSMQQDTLSGIRTPASTSVRMVGYLCLFFVLSSAIRLLASYIQYRKAKKQFSSYITVYTIDRLATFYNLRLFLSIVSLPYMRCLENTTLLISFRT